jgi:hypothetical protein
VVLTRSCQLGELSEQRRQMLGVEDGEPDHQAGIGAAVGNPGPQVGEPRPQTLRHRAAVDAVGLGPRLEVFDEALCLGCTALEAFADGGFVEQCPDPRPAVDQVPRHHVELPVGAVLGGVELGPLGRHGLDSRYRAEFRSRGARVPGSGR